MGPQNQLRMREAVLFEQGGEFVLGTRRDRGREEASVLFYVPAVLGALLVIAVVIHSAAPRSASDFAFASG